MATSFLGVETSVILVAVFSVIGSYAQNGTQLGNVFIAEDNTTAPVYNKSITANETTTELSTEATNFTSTSNETHVSTSSRPKLKLNITTEDGRISSPPQPSNVALPPGAMTLSAITCAVIIGVFIVCYISTMMNLCFCKFLMHECPTGRFKDEPDAAAKKQKGKKKDEAPLPDPAAPASAP